MPVGLNNGVSFQTKECSSSPSIIQDSDDDWDTDHDVINMSEEQQRWGGARDTGTLDMDKFRWVVIVTKSEIRDSF